MRILVCIKQVPGTGRVEVDEKTGVLKRDSAEAKMNPFDLFSIEQALRLKESYGGSVDVLTMGPEQAEEVLKEALWMGADRAVLLSDRAFAGSDVAATAYALTQGINKAGSYDLILCGKQTTDGDTAQVGPEVAELLGIEHICNVQSVEKWADEEIIVTENQEKYIRRLKVCLPCLLTIEKDANTPRLPSLKRAMYSKDQNIVRLTMEDLSDRTARHYGLTGSPTQVERIFPPEKKEGRQMFEEDPKQLASKIYTILAQKKFISPQTGSSDLGGGTL